MRAVITPSRAHGSVSAPPSKSMAHRYLICAALSHGRSVIDNVAFSKDIKATISCINALGAHCTADGGKITVDGIAEPNRGAVLDCGECGSTLRFFVPICASFGGEYSFTGSTTLLARPMSVYEQIFRERGIAYSNDGEFIRINGTLSGGDFVMDGGISSQFVSGMLFSLPTAQSDSTIELIPPVESRPYIDLTTDALRTFGIEVEESGNSFAVKGGQRYRACNVTVEGDYSNAAFLDAFNYVDGDVTVLGLGESRQGDRVYKELFEKLARGGCDMIDISDCPDLGPVLFALAAIYGGSFCGTRRLRIKESDRCAAMAAELAKLGARCEIGEDTMEVCKTALRAPAEPIDSHNDHRIAMAMSILLSKVGGEIDNAGAVAKSMPDFFEKIKQLGIGVECIEDN